MNEEKKLEEALRASAENVFQDSNSQKHLEDWELEALVETFKPLSAQAQHHLSECTECRNLVAALLEGQPNEGAKVLPLRPLRRALIPLIPIAATVALFAVLRPVAPPKPPVNDVTRNRGLPPKLLAEVTLLATLSGVRRDVRTSQTLKLNERLGFKYGNPNGEVKTLTLLGWDGVKIHWYYPEFPQGEAYRLKWGPKVLGIRLPFDIELKEKHKPGPLVVAAAFDADPKAIAEKLRKGALVESNRVKIFRLTVITK